LKPTILSTYARDQNQQQLLFLISNFRLVLNVAIFVLGDSQASEFYVPTLRNTATSIFTGGVSSSLHTIHKPGNHPKERIQQLMHFVMIGW